MQIGSTGHSTTLGGHLLHILAGRRPRPPAAIDWLRPACPGVAAAHTFGARARAPFLTILNVSEWVPVPLLGKLGTLWINQTRRRIRKAFLCPLRVSPCALVFFYRRILAWCGVLFCYNTHGKFSLMWCNEFLNCFLELWYVVFFRFSIFTKPLYVKYLQSWA
jgi:hypothetical protein